METKTFPEFFIKLLFIILISTALFQATATLYYGRNPNRPIKNRNEKSSISFQEEEGLEQIISQETGEVIEMSETIPEDNSLTSNSYEQPQNLEEAQNEGILIEEEETNEDEVNILIEVEKQRSLPELIRVEKKRKEIRKLRKMGSTSLIHQNKQQRLEECLSPIDMSNALELNSQLNPQDLFEVAHIFEDDYNQFFIEIKPISSLRCQCESCGDITIENGERNPFASLCCAIRYSLLEAIIKGPAILTPRITPLHNSSSFLIYTVLPFDGEYTLDITIKFMAFNQGISQFNSKEKPKLSTFTYPLKSRVNKKLTISPLLITAKRSLEDWQDEINFQNQLRERSKIEVQKMKQIQVSQKREARNIHPMFISDHSSPTSSSHHDDEQLLEASSPKLQTSKIDLHEFLSNRRPPCKEFQYNHYMTGYWDPNLDIFTPLNCTLKYFQRQTKSIHQVLENKWIAFYGDFSTRALFIVFCDYVGGIRKKEVDYSKQICFGNQFILTYVQFVPMINNHETLLDPLSKIISKIPEIEMSSLPTFIQDLSGPSIIFLSPGTKSIQADAARSADSVLSFIQNRAPEQPLAILLRLSFNEEFTQEVKNQLNVFNNFRVKSQNDIWIQANNNRFPIIDFFTPSFSLSQSETQVSFFEHKLKLYFNLSQFLLNFLLSN